MAGAGVSSLRVRRTSKVPFNSNAVSFYFPKTVLSVILKSSPHDKYNYFLHFKDEERDVHSSLGTHSKITQQEIVEPTPGLRLAYLRGQVPILIASLHGHYTASLADISANLLAQLDWLTTVS